MYSEQQAPYRSATCTTALQSSGKNLTHTNKLKEFHHKGKEKEPNHDTFRMIEHLCHVTFLTHPLLHHVLSSLFPSKIMASLIGFYLRWKKDKETVADFFVGPFFQESGCHHPYPQKSSYLLYIQRFMGNKEIDNYKGKTHAWFMRHRTIVHWHLKHCSLTIEQWCVGA
ncbi:MAG: hypothetical protein GXY64_10400 [Bacteroidales bacterium]|nr:hypothetical protein [Bacteroidales bacterium]